MTTTSPDVRQLPDLRMTRLEDGPGVTVEEWTIYQGRYGSDCCPSRRYPNEYSGPRLATVRVHRLAWMVGDDQDVYDDIRESVDRHAREHGID